MSKFIIVSSDKYSDCTSTNVTVVNGICTVIKYMYDILTMYDEESNITYNCGNKYVFADDFIKCEKDDKRMVQEVERKN